MEIPTKMDDCGVPLFRTLPLVIEHSELENPFFGKIIYQQGIYPLVICFIAIESCHRNS